MSIFFFKQRIMPSHDLERVGKTGVGEFVENRKSLTLRNSAGPVLDHEVTSARENSAVSFERNISFFNFDPSETCKDVRTKRRTAPALRLRIFYHCSALAPHDVLRFFAR